MITVSSPRPEHEVQAIVRQVLGRDVETWPGGLLTEFVIDTVSDASMVALFKALRGDAHSLSTRFPASTPATFHGAAPALAIPA